MTLFRVVIVDDEPLARENLEILLRRDADMAIAAACGNGFEAIEAVERLSPDLMFLDVQMPRLSGFEVLARLDPALRPVTVFTTAYDQYALRAFESNALDYLLKPFSDDRFFACLGRAKGRIAQTRQLRHLERLQGLLETVLTGERPEGPRSFRQRIAVQDGKQVRFIKVTDIDWIAAAGNYVELHVGGKVYLVRETLAALELAMDPGRFARIHRSAMVNLDRVAGMVPRNHEPWKVILEDGTRLTLSRNYRDRLRERLGTH